MDERFDGYQEITLDRFSNVFLLGILLCTIAFKARNIYLEQIIQEIVTEKTGLNIYIGNVESSLFLNKIILRGVTVENPDPFKRKLFIYLPKLSISTDIPSLLQIKKLQFHLLDFEIEKINIIRKADGRVNLREISLMAENSSAVGRTIGADYVRFDIKDATFYDELDLSTNARSYPIDTYNITFTGIDSLDDIIDAIIKEVTIKAKLGETLNVVSDKLFLNIKNLQQAPGKLANIVKTPSDHLLGILKNNPSKN